MTARTGDRVTVDGHHVGSPPRHGVITEVLGGSGTAHYQVRWDSGESSIVYPQSDFRVTPRSRPVVDEETFLSDRSDVDLRLDRSEGRQPRLHMWLAEDEAHTEARVTVQLREVEMTGFGVARRNPHDPHVPMVGEELAMSRALQDLADQLLRLARYQIERREGRPVDLTL
jgi:hypothetical protein